MATAKTTPLLTVAAVTALFFLPGEARPEGDESTPDERVQEVEAESGDVSAEELLEQRSLPFSEADLDYTPTKATRFRKIRRSKLGKNFDKQDYQRLDARGFVVDGDWTGYSFLTGYEHIYHQDLPVYVSADSLMHALHRSFDPLLADFEKDGLRGEIESMLRKMRRAVDAGAIDAFGAETRSDLDWYLTTTLSLLTDEESPVEPLHEENADRVGAFFESAVAAKGARKQELFGTRRKVDFSQFKPRGHYTHGLEQYFRAMMLLGRIDLRMTEVTPSNEVVFRRRQFDAAMGLAKLLDRPEIRAHWERVEQTLRAFMGRSDYLGPGQIPELLDALEVDTPAATLKLKDADIKKALTTTSLGRQRIGGHFRAVSPGISDRKLPRSFAILGQRYVPDSEVFHRTTQEQVADRTLPDPLDAAYAVFGNDQAAGLLADDLERYPELPVRLEATRRLFDRQEADFWSASLYARWLTALRALSPQADRLSGEANDLPRTMRTEAWGRRMLNTQMASWAELRHDTILYAKQSYTASILCSFPDVYVDPYPAFYDALVDFARAAKRLDADLLSERHRAKFKRAFDAFERAGTVLGDIARRQQAGEAPTDEQLAFVNRMVRVKRTMGCGPQKSIQTPGWYLDLYYQKGSADEADPIVADVHTDGSKDTGPRVLHVGTERPDLMIVTVDGCSGPAAYIGLVSSYREHIADGLERLTDSDWKLKLQEARRGKSQSPVRPAWMEPVVAP